MCRSLYWKANKLYDGSHRAPCRGSPGPEFQNGKSRGYGLDQIWVPKLRGISPLRDRKKCRPSGQDDRFPAPSILSVCLAFAPLLRTDSGPDLRPSCSQVLPGTAGLGMFHFLGSFKGTAAVIMLMEPFVRTSKSPPSCFRRSRKSTKPGSAASFRLSRIPRASSRP